MTDVFSPEQRSNVMRAVKSSGTQPELTLRRALFGLGYRYRLGGRGLPGKPDLVFAGPKLAVFVHGCFWHGHDCARGARAPKANAAYWQAKIAGNVARDIKVQAELTALGWRSAVVWECELKPANRAALLARLEPCLKPQHRH